MHLTITMEVRDTIELDLVRQVQEVITAYRNGPALERNQHPAAPPAPQPQDDTARVQAAVDKAVATGQSQVVEPAPAPVAQSGDEVQLVRELVAKKGLPAARKILDEFQVSTVSKLDAAQKPAFVEKVRQALEAV